MGHPSIANTVIYTAVADKRIRTNLGQMTTRGAAWDIDHDYPAWRGTMRRGRGNRLMVVSAAARGRHRGRRLQPTLEVDA
jgi:hypothetical protein